MRALFIFNVTTVRNDNNTELVGKLNSMSYVAHAARMGNKLNS